MRPDPGWYRWLIGLSLLLTLLMVVLSAYIRLAEVGIGCEGWPDCYAQLDADVEKKGITVLTEEGRDMAHYSARIAHRYIASTLGLFILGLTILALRRGNARTTGLAIPLLVFAVTVFLSLLGYYTPTRSNPLITMGNLLGGMAMLGLLWWLMLRETVGDGLTMPENASRYRQLSTAALCLVVMQILLGAWSSANYASAACPDLLQCQGVDWAPAALGDVFNPLREIELDGRGQVLRDNALGALSMAHRLFAIVTAAYLAWLVRKLKADRQLTPTVLAMSVFSIAQVIVGVTMVWLALPLLLVTLHNALAAGLLLASISLQHRLTPPARSQPPG